MVILYERCECFDTLEDENEDEVKEDREKLFAIVLIFFFQLTFGYVMSVTKIFASGI